MKLCATCNIERDEVHFTKSRRSLDGLRYNCKFCNYEYERKNKEKIKLYQQAKNKRPEIRESIRKYVIKRAEANPSMALWEGYKKRARSKNIDFNIEVSDIVIPKICPILGIVFNEEKMGPNRPS